MICHTLCLLFCVERSAGTHGETCFCPADAHEADDALSSYPLQSPLRNGRTTWSSSPCTSERRAKTSASRRCGRDPKPRSRMLLLHELSAESNRHSPSPSHVAPRPTL